MGCNGSKAAHGNGAAGAAYVVAKGAGNGTKRLSINMADTEERFTSPKLLGSEKGGKGKKRLSVNMANMNEASKPASNDILAECDDSDMLELLDRSHTLTGSTTGSVCIGSTNDMNLTDSFKKKTIAELGDISNFDKSVIGHTCRKGKKPKSANQDSYCIMQAVNFSIYGIFDGHGEHGHLVSYFVKNSLPRLLVQDADFLEPLRRVEVLKRAFIKCQEAVEKAHQSKKFDCTYSGTTVTLVLHDRAASKLFAAHCGDSSCCVGKAGSAGAVIAEKLTEDHKPNDPAEKARIEASGGQVVYDGYANYRVFVKGKRYPGMAMSRALGDLSGHKAGVIAEPSVSEVQLTSEHLMLLLCSDGVWEFIQPQLAVEKVLQSEQIQDGVEALVSLAWDEWIREEAGEVVDDITAIAVSLSEQHGSECRC